MTAITTLSVGLAGLTVAVALCAALSRSPGARARHGMCHNLARVTGSTAAVILALLVLGRAIALGVEIWQGGPVGRPEVMALPPAGLWACGLLIVATVLAVFTQHSRLGAPPLSPAGAVGWGTEGLESGSKERNETALPEPCTPALLKSSGTGEPHCSQSSGTGTGAPPLSPEGAVGWGTEGPENGSDERNEPATNEHIVKVPAAESREPYTPALLKSSGTVAGSPSSRPGGVARWGTDQSVAALFALCVLTGSWAALSLAPFPDSIYATGERGPIFLLWIPALGVTLCAFIIAEGLLIRRRRFHLLWNNPSELAVPTIGWSRFDGACAAAGWLLMLLICANFAWPVEVAWLRDRGGYRASAALVALVALAASTAMFALANRRWRIASADVAAGLLTLSLCAGALCFVPANPRELEARFPMHLNAMLVGLAVMAGTWIWLAGVWEQQLDNGRAWTTTGRLHGFAPRYALAAGLLGLFVAAMMGLWPRLPGMATRDASFGRMAAGIAGHLLLMLALMVGARRWRRPVFSLLAGGGAVSLIVFLVMRLADFVRVVR